MRDALAEYAAAGLPETALQTHYEDAVVRIKRRLGGARLTELTHKIQQAFSHQCDHRDWIRYLLTEYYDPMYDFQLQKKADRVQFRAPRQDVQAFLLEQP